MIFMLWDVMETTNHSPAKWAKRRLLVNLTQTDRAVNTQFVIASIDSDLLWLIQADPTVSPIVLKASYTGCSGNHAVLPTHPSRARLPTNNAATPPAKHSMPVAYNACLQFKTLHWSGSKEASGSNVLGTIHAGRVFRH